MQAVIKTGGKQYRVAEGDVLGVERLRAEPGDEIGLDALLVFDEGGMSRVGTVKVRVVEEFRGPKLIVFKYKNKTGYRKKNGHRQEQTRIEVVEISKGS